MPDQKLTNLQTLIESIELPDSAEKAAERRYKALGDWFDRNESSLRAHRPHIFPQGSFAIGTAIAPLSQEDGYDLDLACKLRTGISRKSHAQVTLKKLVKDELNAFRKAYQILEPLEEMNRCWRLKYKDELKFHEDIVPAIPADTGRTTELTERLVAVGRDRPFAERLAAGSTWITDRTRHSFSQISDDWLRSNQEGYKDWFLSRMRPGVDAVNKMEAKVDSLPNYPRKDPLQRVVQLLKRHRDVMFQDESTKKSRPISIIITTLVARDHQPGLDLATSMELALNNLQAFREGNFDHVWNPADPTEEFTDKWNDGKHTELKLKENFHGWIEQVCTDFRRYLATGNMETLYDDAGEGLRIARPLGGNLAVIPPTISGAVSPTARDATSIGINEADPITALHRGGTKLLHRVKSFFPWMATPTWKFRGTGTVIIRATREGAQVQSGQIMPKGIYIDFAVLSSNGGSYPLPDGFNVHWQVVNTGQDAFKAGTDQLRGGFYPSDPPGRRREHTQYRGIHWVRAFVVNRRNNTCIASSERFFVAIE